MAGEMTIEEIKRLPWVRAADGRLEMHVFCKGVARHLRNTDAAVIFHDCYWRSSRCAEKANDTSLRLEGLWGQVTERSLNEELTRGAMGLQIAVADDRVWWRMPMSELERKYDYMNPGTIRGALKKLVEMDYLVKRTNPPWTEGTHDRSAWYALGSEGMKWLAPETMPSKEALGVSAGQTHLKKSADAFANFTNAPAPETAAKLADSGVSAGQTHLKKSADAFANFTDRSVNLTSGHANFTNAIYVEYRDTVDTHDTGARECGGNGASADFSDALSRLAAIDRKRPEGPAARSYDADTAAALSAALARGRTADEIVAAYRAHVESLEASGEARYVKRMPKFLSEPDGLERWAGAPPARLPAEIPVTHPCPDCGGTMRFDGYATYYCTNPECSHHGAFDGEGKLMYTDGMGIAYPQLLGTAR